MVIVWAIVIAGSLLLELVTYDLICFWFVAGSLVSLVLAAVGVSLSIQIIVFFVVSLALFIFLRPIAKKYLKTPTIATNADANIGKIAKLLSDVVEGRAIIKINGVIWTVACEDELHTSEKVIITGISGNKFIVKKVEEKK